MDDRGQMSGTGKARAKAPAADRRAVRTDKALRQALLSLLRRKTYDDITVQDIIAEADVGRSTFYAHCSGKEDLLRRGLRTLRSEFADRRSRADGSPPGALPFSLKVLEHVAGHRDLYPNLGRHRGREVLIRELRQVVLGLVREDLDAMPYGEEEVPREVAEEFIVGAFMSLLLWSLEHRVAQSPAQIDAMFQRLIQHGIPPRSRRSGSE